MALRIYVGGLGTNVKEEDLKKTFTSPFLGSVESVEIIRTKGRSFGYIQFLPASDKGLSKLFSTYNGCMWKGGKLKLEKAKEDYTCRLQREWTEDAELAIKLSSQKTDSGESIPTMQKPKKDQDRDNMEIRMFFPKLRKIKPLPLKGTGKHKYSFQRVEIPPLPINFCDCEEHSVQFSKEPEIGGVNEKELDMMKSILSKLLKEEVKEEVEVVEEEEEDEDEDEEEEEDEEDYPMGVSNENEFTEEINHKATSIDNMTVDENQEDQVSDEDELVINIVGQPRNRVASFENWGQKITATNQDSLLKMKSHEMNEREKQKLPPNNKRKQSNDVDNTVPSKRNQRKGSSHDNLVDSVALNAESTETQLGSVQISSEVASSHKTTWKNLVQKKGATSFHISDILTDINRGAELELNNVNLTSPEKESENDQSSEDEELEECDELASPEKESEDDQSSEDEELEEIDNLDSPEKENKDGPSSEDEELEEIDHLAAIEKDSEDDQSSEDEELEEIDTGTDKDSEDDQSGEDEELEEIDAGAEKDSEDYQFSEDEELEEIDNLTASKKDSEDDQSSEDEEMKEIDNLDAMEKDSEDDQSTKDEELEKVSDAQPTKPVKDNSGRGASWLQKSSWLQLVGDANSRAFNLGQILPGVTFEKQELQQFDNNNLSNSIFGKQQKIVRNDKKSPTGGIKKPDRKADVDMSVGLGNSNMDASSKEQSHSTQSNSDTKQTLENHSIAKKRASIGDIVVSETCPFMRTAASVKEWAKTKAALSGSLKKKGVKER